MNRPSPELMPLSESKAMKSFAVCILAVILVAIFADYGKEVWRLDQEVKLRAIEKGCVLLDGR